MKTTIISLLALLTLISSSFSGEGRGDTGTLRLSWSEFSNTKFDRSSISVGKAFYNQDTGSEWNKYEVRFEITNKSTSNIKVRYLISIFDKSQNLIYSASEDKGIDGLETKEVKSKVKIGSSVKFDPETVYIRVWWE